MRSYYDGVWVVLLAVLVSGCPFEGTTKFSGDTTDYTHETIHSITVSTSGETLMDGRPLTDELRVKMFVQTSLVRGNGEYLASLAHLAKIPAVRQQEFFEHATRQYAAAIRTERLTPGQLSVVVMSNWKYD